jgi:hypothetical protein
VAAERVVFAEETALQHALDDVTQLEHVAAALRHAHAVFHREVPLAMAHVRAAEVCRVYGAPCTTTAGCA